MQVPIKSQAKICCPQKVSFIEYPENTIAFFSKARANYENNRSVIYDLELVEDLSETFAAVLMSYLKDRNVNKGLISDIVFPKNDELERKLKKFGIYKKIPTNSNDFDIGVLPTTKVGNQLVATEVAKVIVDQTTNLVFGKKVRQKELYSTLIEMMANTNNHAIANTPQHQPYSWWLFVFADRDTKLVKFVFLDLGVGIFESIPVKQFIRKYPAKFGDPVSHVQQFSRGNQIAEIYSQLVSGGIKSRTGDPLRGKGIPRIFNNSKNKHFKDFYLVSNDAFIDMRSGNTSPMNENFRGTIFYFSFGVPDHGK